MGIIALKWLAKAHYKPYALIGGATALIGDPSGKDQERPLKQKDEIVNNSKKIEHLLKSILQANEGEEEVIIVNNSAWLEDFSFINFLRDIGKHFRLGPMLAKESVKIRLSSQEGMSFTEFSYQLLQSYDFYHLFSNYGINLQVGGSDQWGNITAGIEFIRKVTGKETYGFAFPLLVRSDGRKFGKSEQGAIWLSEEKLSSYDFYQYLFRVSDLDVIKLMKLLTFMDLAEIEQIEKDMQTSSYIPNTAQKKLAEEVTKFVHKEEGLKKALLATENTAPGAKINLSGSFENMMQNMPHKILEKEKVLNKKYTEVLRFCGLVSSNSEAVRLINNQGAYLNEQKITDPSFVITEKEILNGAFLVLGTGKKNKLLIKIFPSL
jgi:tyrosyl-tRNA synthetase